MKERKIQLNYHRLCGILIDLYFVPHEYRGGFRFMNEIRCFGAHFIQVSYSWQQNFDDYLPTK